MEQQPRPAETLEVQLAAAKRARMAAEYKAKMAMDLARNMMANMTNLTSARIAEAVGPYINEIDASHVLALAKHADMTTDPTLKMSVATKVRCPLSPDGAWRICFTRSAQLEGVTFQSVRTNNGIDLVIADMTPLGPIIKDFGCMRVYPRAIGIRIVPNQPRPAANEPAPTADGHDPDCAQPVCDDEAKANVSGSNKPHPQRPAKVSSQVEVRRMDGAACEKIAKGLWKAHVAKNAVKFAAMCDKARRLVGPAMMVAKGDARSWQNLLIAVCNGARNDRKLQPVLEFNDKSYRTDEAIAKRLGTSLYERRFLIALDH